MNIHFLRTFIVFLLLSGVGTLYSQQAIHIDTADSRIKWTASKPTGEHRGYIKLSNGQLIVSNNKVTGGTFDINMKSIVDSDLSERQSNDKLINDLKSPQFFDASKYPISHFVITGIESLNNKDVEHRKYTHRIEGDLTIRGITKKVSFDASINLLNGKFTASTPAFTINRTKWGINYQSKSSKTKDEYIYDDITLEIDLVSE
ncbi:MAG TPA: YceI family protein [Bacteroidales bacterium]|nr:YceI family protein [Bacteroidales bacterium]